MSACGAGDGRDGSDGDDSGYGRVIREGDNGGDGEGGNRAGVDTGMWSK